MCCELGNDIPTAFRSYLVLRGVEDITLNVQPDHCLYVGLSVCLSVAPFRPRAPCRLRRRGCLFHICCAEMRGIMYAVETQLDALNISWRGLRALCFAVSGCHRDL